MNNMIDDKLIQNINGIILALRSNGVDKLSITKMLLLINDNFRIELDEESLTDVLSSIPSVSEIIGDQIVIGSKKTSEEEQIDANTHDRAVQQASDNMTSESVEYGKFIGKTISMNDITLTENMNNYHLLRGVKKTKTNLTVIDVLVGNKLSESVLRCKVGSSNIMVDLPIKMLKK